MERRPLLVDAVCVVRAVTPDRCLNMGTADHRGRWGRFGRLRYQYTEGNAVSMNRPLFCGFAKDWQKSISLFFFFSCIKFSFGSKRSSLKQFMVGSVRYSSKPTAGDELPYRRNKAGEYSPLCKVCCCYEFHIIYLFGAPHMVSPSDSPYREWALFLGPCSTKAFCVEFNILSLASKDHTPRSTHRRTLITHGIIQPVQPREMDYFVTVVPFKVFPAFAHSVFLSFPLPQVRI